jgi:hypothetical protein
VGGPGEVRFEEGRPALELVELTDGNEMVNILPGVRRKLVVSDAELMPIDGGECEGRVFAREGKRCRIGIGFPS